MSVRSHRSLLIGTALSLGTAALALAPHARAQAAASGRAEASVPKGKLDLPSLKKALESPEESQTLAALDAIGKSGNGAGAGLVEALLQRGASTPVVGRALDTLATLGQATSVRAVAPYSLHRNLEIRRAALRALIATKSPAAAEPLQRALHGNDAQARGIAAYGLGELGARQSVPDLFGVVTKQVPEAATSLGKLCVAETCERFIGLLGKLPFEVMESGLVPLLLRPEAEVSDALKLKLVERLRRMATAPATALLRTALAGLPKDGSARLRAGIEGALKGRSVASEAP